jgi:hypothetical protein
MFVHRQQECFLARWVARRRPDDRIYSAMRAKRRPGTFLQPLFDPGACEGLAAIEAATNIALLQFFPVVSGMPVRYFQHFTRISHRSVPNDLDNMDCTPELRQGKLGSAGYPM